MRHHLEELAYTGFADDTAAAAPDEQGWELQRARRSVPHVE
jgi:hypothetical protein